MKSNWFSPCGAKMKFHLGDHPDQFSQIWLLLFNSAVYFCTEWRSLNKDTNFSSFPNVHEFLPHHLFEWLIFIFSSWNRISGIKHKNYLPLLKKIIAHHGQHSILLTRIWEEGKLAKVAHNINYTSRWLHCRYHIAVSNFWWTYINSWNTLKNLLTKSPTLSTNWGQILQNYTCCFEKFVRISDAILHSHKKWSHTKVVDLNKVFNAQSF